MPRFICRMAGLVLVFGMIGLSRSSDDLPRSVLNIPKAIKGESCVEPIEVMRRRHMEILFHQRDQTMYSGMRDGKHSLIGCVSCHTRKDDQGKYIPINAEGQFCRECHSYVATQIDCFGCHAATPLTDEQIIE